MTVPNIDTFEHDIRAEIKNKEASIGDIASAANDISNTPPAFAEEEAHANKKLFIWVAFIAFIALVGFSVLGYLYYTGQPTTPEAAQTLLSKEEQAARNKDVVRARLEKISPTLTQTLLPVAEQITSSAYGTDVTISNYSAAFARMLQNEEAIAEEVLDGTYTLDASSTPVFVFTDITRSNQNMRSVTVGSSTFVYAFIGEHHLVFSSSSEGILSLRNSITK